MRRVCGAANRDGWIGASISEVRSARAARPDVQAKCDELLEVLKERAPKAMAAAPAKEAAIRVESVAVGEPRLEPHRASVTPHVSLTDSLLITEPIYVELVRVDDGLPLRMGTPPGQVQGMRRRFDWIWPKDEDHYFDREQPASMVSVAPFAIGRYPVTNVEYTAFMRGTGYSAPEHFDWDLPPQGREQHPVVNVTWRDAVAFTEWLSRASGQAIRLPTEVEWEKAARGADGRLWPWGDEWDAKRGNTLELEGRQSDTTPVGAYSPHGDSPFGAADMAGNVIEWCTTKWRDDYTVPPDDALDGDVSRVARGGSFNDFAIGVRCAARGGWPPLFSNSNFGFRVAISL